MPDFKIRKLENISGQVVDEDERPIGGAIARLFVGVWGSEYVTCDAEGRFSIPPDIIVATARHQTSPMEVSVIAFDTKSNRCGLHSITENWQTAQQLRIVCEDTTDHLVDDGDRRADEKVSSR